MGMMINRRTASRRRPNVKHGGDEQSKIPGNEVATKVQEPAIESQIWIIDFLLFKQVLSARGI
jgi:hypothetical protein